MSRTWMGPAGALTPGAPRGRGRAARPEAGTVEQGGGAGARHLSTDPGELAERVCRECGQTFTYDPERFVGFRPPGLCRECNSARRARLVTVEGTVLRVGPFFAVIGAAGEEFYWHLRAADQWAERPRRGDRVLFTRDPDELAAGRRLPLARNVRPNEAAGAACR